MAKLLARKGSTVAYRAAVGAAVATVVLLLWINAAVGTEDDNSGGLMFLGVLVVGIGALVARFQPQGMARALFAAALCADEGRGFPRGVSAEADSDDSMTARASGVQRAPPRRDPRPQSSRPRGPRRRPRRPIGDAAPRASRAAVRPSARTGAFRRGRRGIRERSDATLLKEFGRLVAALRPRAGLMENVPAVPVAFAEALGAAPMKAAA